MTLKSKLLQLQIKGIHESLFFDNFCIIYDHYRSSFKDEIYTSVLATGEATWIDCRKSGCLLFETEAAAQTLALFTRVKRRTRGFGCKTHVELSNWYCDSSSEQIIG